MISKFTINNVLYMICLLSPRICRQVGNQKLGIHVVCHIHNNVWRDYLLDGLHKDKTRPQKVDMIDEDELWGHCLSIYGGNYVKEFVKKHDTNCIIEKTVLAKKNIIEKIVLHSICSTT